MTILIYITKRLTFVVPQLLGIMAVTFFLLKLIPGDPAILMLGPMATKSSIAELRQSLGLDDSLLEQFWIYASKAFSGDLGTSWQSTQPVMTDLLQRFPATLELVTLGLLLALAIGIPLGIAAGRKKSGIIARIADQYGLIAGALPDFWIALVFILIFYSFLGWAPSPLGRIDFAILPPPQVTGSLVIDGLLDRNWEALFSVVTHLVLPVLTLGILNAGPILKMTRVSVEGVLQSDFIAYHRLCGLPDSMVLRKAIRVALPSVITVVSVLYGYLLGGAVLVETVFSWGGAGQYAVQGVLNADINPVIGFVLFSAVFSLVVYLIVDLIYFTLDPRTRDE